MQKASVTPVSEKDKQEKPGTTGLSASPSVSGKVMEQLIMETISRQMKDQKVIVSG